MSGASRIYVTKMVEVQEYVIGFNLPRGTEFVTLVEIHYNNFGPVYIIWDLELLDSPLLALLPR